MTDDTIDDTIKSLNDICVSILQTNRNIAQDMLIGKLSFASTTVGVSALVASLGTAGTGTAIASLSGAASTSATLAWIGGSVVVGGAMLTGGAIAVAVGSVYLYNGKKRVFDELCQYEKEIVNASMKMIKELQEEQKSQTKATKYDIAVLCDRVLYPLLINIYDYTDDISSNLNTRYKKKFADARIGLMRCVDKIKDKTRIYNGNFFPRY